MTPERFLEIVDAYGAAARRWPAEERAEAEAFALNDAEAQATLAREAGLDRMLGAYRIAPAGSALTGAIIASARPRRRLSWAVILKGLGIVGAGLAGALVGTFLMMVYAPSTPTFADDDQPILTSFDVSGGDYDLDDTP
ncbi:MAG: hypothetical protein H6Q99_2695 [Proteobacteria bacterium]|nr:hypothetical protein [Pseudomonadota bacterium]